MSQVDRNDIKPSSGLGPFKVSDLDRPAVFELTRRRSLEAETDRPKESSWIEPTKHNIGVGSEISSESAIGRTLIGVTLLLGSAAIHPAFFVFCIIVLMVCLAVKKLDSGRLPPEFARIGLGSQFVPEPGIRDDEFLVDIHIYVKGQEIGVDRGVIGIDDGALFFAGSSCSFQLGSQDIDLSYSFEKQWRSSINVPLGCALLRIRHSTKKLEILVERVTSLELVHHRGDLSDILRNFAVHAMPTKKPRSYPPVTSPSIIQERTF